jgi:hypothetical protein
MEPQGRDLAFQPGSGQVSGETQCERVVMAWLESPLRVENCQVGQSLGTHLPQGIYIVRTMVWDHQEVPVRVLNATCRYKKLTKESFLAHCELVMLVTPPDVEQPQVWDSYPEVTGRDCSRQGKPEWCYIPRGGRAHRVQWHLCYEEQCTTI